MNYQASSSEEESLELASQNVPSASALGVNALDFSYIGMSDMDTVKVRKTKCPLWQDSFNRS